MVQSGRVSYDVRRGLIRALADTGHHLVGHGKESSDAARGGPELWRNPSCAAARTAGIVGRTTPVDSSSRSSIHHPVIRRGAPTHMAVVFAGGGVQRPGACGTFLGMVNR